MYICIHYIYNKVRQQEHTRRFSVCDVTHNVQTLKIKACDLRGHNTKYWNRTDSQLQHCTIRQTLSYLLPSLYYSCSQISSVSFRPIIANSTHMSPTHQSNVRRITLLCSHITHSITSEYVDVWTDCTKHTPVRSYQVLIYLCIMLLGTAFWSSVTEATFRLQLLVLFACSNFQKKKLSTKL